jgi:hypothetical protein
MQSQQQKALLTALGSVNSSIACKQVVLH